MNKQITTFYFFTLVVGTMTAYAQIPVARVGDVTHLQGEGTNVLVGYGLVTGLNGTGDGKKSLATMAALATTLERFGQSFPSLDDMGDPKNVAVVMIEVVVPDHGAREGERFEVSVTALHAKSLLGGRLLSTPLVYHDRTVEGLFGFAQGSIEIDAESDMQTNGLIRGGARMERDIMMNVVVFGSDLSASGFRSDWIMPGQTYMTVVLDEPHAGWSMAAAVSQAIDKELSVSADVERVALAVDSKNILVLIPEHQRNDAASWIRDVERTPILMESNEARVTVNRRSQTIVISGDTRMSPVIISQAGLTVTVASPLPDGTIPQPPFTQENFVAVDVADKRMPNVNDLLEALNRLKVPFKDRLSIIEEIHRAGKLHAKIMYES